MKSMFSRALVALTFFTFPVLADDAGELKTKLASLESFTAQFSQVVTDEKGETVHEASGALTMARPDKLRWETQVPDETLLIADGETVWHLDYWVEQVTVMSQQQAVDNNPMVLLTSNDDSVWQQYEVTILDDGTFKVVANEGSSQIRALTLSFDESGLAALNMLDSQGQQSAITFAQRQFNQAVAETTFSVSVPDGFMVDDQRP